ncbi:MFS transporter [Chitinophaga oryziterrae]|uniref:MFS transporter n=1 Tax=Chitinophaga oryziterrae TaxID=1031224 RepID=A0A6N8JFK2_9BACT|nr:MFS transporter [Chitinophaga oryziterrae]MVT44033.1 MFS transporter [Chitinophaga oryziterrae]
MEKMILNETQKSEAQKVAEKTVFSVLLALSFSHLINDTIQSLIPAIYPLVKDSLHLTFTQVGLITLTYQLTASLLQPLVGLYTDKNPKPYSLAIGMGFTLAGLISLSQAHHFHLVLLSVGLVGVGSSVFHPEASRLAYMASGGKHGMAQSLFQLGGNAGSSLGPLFAAMIIVPKGQSSISWFSLAAILAIVVMLNIGGWYKKNTHRIRSKSKGTVAHVQLPGSKVIFALGILLMLVFSKYFYMASMTSYYTFYLISKFHVPVQSAQIYLFIFMFAIAAGTFIGGPVGDRIGRKYVIWISILGVAPFSLLLPHANLLWTSVLSVFIGVILSSAFSAILVYAQELVPGKVGMIAGLFFGLAFGMGGVGSAVLGKLADNTSIEYVFQVCAYLPLIGLLTGLLPDVGKSGK